MLAALSVLIALLGIGAGWYMFQKRPLLQMPRLLENKYYVDEIYDAALIRPIEVGSREGLWKIFDVGRDRRWAACDRRNSHRNGRLGRWLQAGFVRGYAAIILLGALILIGLFAFIGLSRSFRYDRLMSHLLTILILLPVAGALALVLYSFVSGRREEHYRWIALIVTVATFVVSLLLLHGIGASGAEFRFEENVSWIGSIGARYHVAVDGISLWLVLLTTLLMPISVLSSWTAVRKRQLSYYVFLLILESAMIGVFVSLDLLLFYLFFEASLVPMFFLIGIWGGERRIYAAVKFFIYTAVGSLLMLVGIIALYFLYHTFDYPTLLQAINGKPARGKRPRRVLAVSRVCARILYQGSAVSVPHVAAGRTHRSAHGRLGDSRRRVAEDGNVRPAAL